MKKLLYIHGWGFNNYTSNGEKRSWFDRPIFVEELSKFFEVIIVKLPGFFGQPDPYKPWELEDFVKYLDGYIEKENPDYILGYSFGGAVCLRWKKLHPESRVKVVLVSPAIIRKYKIIRFEFIQTSLKSILPEKFIQELSDFYLKYIIRNPYYVKASPVMTQTYRNIVKIDLRQDLIEIPDSITIIYGENDTATPPGLIQATLKDSKSKHDLNIIPRGDHDVGKTHVKELVSIILKI